MAASETVTVACKLPHGVELRVFRMETTNEPVMGGGSREVSKAQQVGESVIIAGVAHPQGGAPRATIAEGGYALTPGVPKDFWEKWLADNKGSDMVRNGMIFAAGAEGSVRAQSRERKDERSGAERLDPAKLPNNLKKATSEAAA